MPTPDKACNICGERKPISEFYSQKVNGDGLARACKPCYYARNQAWRKRNRARDTTDHIPPVKQCSECGESKPSGLFPSAPAAKDGLRPRCQECHSAVGRSRRYALPTKRAKQMGRVTECEVCGSGFASTQHQHFDHRHADGAVRGVLCFRCNKFIGHAQESPEILRAAAEYLERTAGVDYRFQPYPEQNRTEGDISTSGDPTPEEPRTKCQTTPPKKSTSPHR